MTEIAIQTRGLGKRYRLGSTISYRTLRESLAAAAGSLFRSQKDRGREEEGTIWAVRGIDLEVPQGSVIGVIGKNGSGKSTLLKLLSRITTPTEGEARILGRVRALLEVGTGFHPELTGRENIFLNGSLLGMRREEIREKFDEIVEFAGMEKFLDTPVKRYSSGMYVRLAFSVAAHLEPEILLVDEVLAVGDAAFQEKCLGKLDSVTREGRTVFLVSHNMATIRNLCPRTILLENGHIAFDGETDQAISIYQNRNLQGGAVTPADLDLNRISEGRLDEKRPTIRFRSISIRDSEDNPRDEFWSGEVIRIRVDYECLETVIDLRLVATLADEENTPLLNSSTGDAEGYHETNRHRPGLYRAVCTIPANLLGEREFFVGAHLLNPQTEHLHLDKILSFKVRFQGYNNLQFGRYEKSWIRPKLHWDTEETPSVPR